jgi:hypothetical protein
MLFREITASYSGNHKKYLFICERNRDCVPKVRTDRGRQSRGLFKYKISVPCNSIYKNMFPPRSTTWRTETVPLHASSEHGRNFLSWQRARMKSRSPLQWCVFRGSTCRHVLGTPRLYLHVPPIRNTSLRNILSEYRNNVSIIIFPCIPQSV